MVEDDFESVFDGILVESDAGGILVESVVGGILLIGDNAESVFDGILVESDVDGILAESVVGGILLVDDDIESVVDGVLLVEEDIESVADDTISVAGLGLSVALYVGLHEASAAIATTVRKIPGFIKEIFFKFKNNSGNGYIIYLLQLCQQCNKPYSFFALFFKLAIGGTIASAWGVFTHHIK